MNFTVNGTGNAYSKPVTNGTLTIKNVNNPMARMSSLRKTENKTKKQLNYNHREISGQIIRAKKPQSASTVLTRAKSKLANLQRAAGTGQYDSKEIANAIAHARRMVRCAQLKVRNLKEEEQERKTNQKKNGAENQQKNNEVKRRVAQKERQVKNKVATEEMQRVMKEKGRRQDLARKCRMHRNEERGKINEADMKYIKGQMENGGGTGSSSSVDSGVFLELSSAAAAASAAQLVEAQLMQEIEAEVEAEIEAELAMETGAVSADLGSAGTGLASGGSEGADAAGAAVGGSVDLSI